MAPPAHPPIDPETGQGDAHVQFAFAAHRAVVDVDVELGLVKVVALDTAQDVGKAINPEAVVGQIQGGSAQGMGLALMEEIVVTDGQVRNPSFTDYLIPTILDMPPMRMSIIEYADPHAPYAYRVGESSSPPCPSPPPTFPPRWGRGFGALGPSPTQRPSDAFAGSSAMPRARTSSRSSERTPTWPAAPLDGGLTPDSAVEQASAGLDRLTPADLAPFTELNEAYRARFGFPFVMGVRGRGVDEILAAYKRRLGNGAEAERRAAVEEIVAIVRLRLEEPP